MSARMMSLNIINGIEEVMNTFEPRKTYDLIKYDKSEILTNYVDQKFIY
jgi:hypothetical protein